MAYTKQINGDGYRGEIVKFYKKITAGMDGVQRAAYHLFLISIIVILFAFILKSEDLGACGGALFRGDTMITENSLLVLVVIFAILVLWGLKLLWVLKRRASHAFISVGQPTPSLNRAERIIEDDTLHRFGNISTALMVLISGALFCFYKFSTSDEPIRIAADIDRLGLWGWLEALLTATL